MRPTLKRWIAADGTRSLIEDLHLKSNIEQLNFVEDRSLDLYYSLVGELFQRLRNISAEGQEWATLGRAFDHVSRNLDEGMRNDALFFSSASFYMGGYPASAVITIRKVVTPDWTDPIQIACHELLSRKFDDASAKVRDLLVSVRIGDSSSLQEYLTSAMKDAEKAVDIGPEEWISRRVFVALLERFMRTNLRAVLPDGYSSHWNRLVQSFLDRHNPVWDFFPSQIEAIDAGLLNQSETFSLQMPTGAGKTALTETLIYSHLQGSRSAKAVLLVPYRALAKELRGTVGRRLRNMGFLTRAVYGGTVPTLEEGQDLENTRAIIATPEALSGLLGAYPELIDSITLVVCDEGHLIDGGSRGIGLEILLARLKSRSSPPRLVFISAIVPNVEEVNTWLGGKASSVVRSNYRPAIAEFATLRAKTTSTIWSTSLELHEPFSTLPTQELENFLVNEDFRFYNPGSGRMRTFDKKSKSSLSVAAARRALDLGTVALFAAQKGGNSGIIGLAQKLVQQISANISLPKPIDYVQDIERVQQATDYLEREFGNAWIGSQVLKFGAVMHHGDLPQETREVLEELVAERAVPLVLCTSTLAEGVNLPIRTMVLYSVERRASGNSSSVMLQRDIKNLVGRAGRATSSTRGLVICADEKVWMHVRPVAEGNAGEPVEGALITLIRDLQRLLEINNIIELKNDNLEATHWLFPLVDGIDSTLIELISEEIGSDNFRELSLSIVGETFAAQRATSNETHLLNKVVQLRTERILQIRESGRLGWIKSSPVKPRLIGPIIDDLLVAYDAWETLDTPNDPHFIEHLVEWAFRQPGFEVEVLKAVRVEEIDKKLLLRKMIQRWISGQNYIQIVNGLEIDMNVALRTHNSIILNSFSTLVEQAIALLKQRESSGEMILSPVISRFPEYLRFGVADEDSRYLLANGIRHRTAALILGNDERMKTNTGLLSTPISVARELLANDAIWIEKLGKMIFLRTVADLATRRVE